MTLDSTLALTGRERAPRLVLRFALLTGACLAAAAVVILAVVRNAYIEQGEQRAIDRARLTTDVVLQRQLRPHDLAGRVSAVRRKQLSRLFTRRVLDDATVAGSLYNTHGLATFSIGGARGLRSPSVAAAVREALGGHVIARVGSGPSGTRRVLSTYVPVVVGPGNARGVIVLERDYSGIAAAARKSSLVVAGVLEALLVALFLLLLPMLARATRRIRAHVAELDDLATHDELTGLANRVGFRRALGRALAGQGSGSVIVVDLDNFHEVNDTVGPEHADALLVAVAERMRELAGPEVVARLGEDEFGLLLSGDGEREIARVAEQVRRDFERPFTLGSARVALEGRAGCARFPEHGTDPVVLMRRAGVALTVAKATRRDVEIYDADHDQSDVSRLTLTAELREALRTGQLLVYYQPQADLATGAVRGAEALVRWNHPQRGLLTASEFILAAERSGLVVDIDRFVREEAARQWQEWRTLGIAIDVAVNVTAVDLLDPRLPEEIETLLRRHQVPPEYLVLEITERTLLRDEHRTRQTLGRLHALGVRLAIDDYGTGYSSLSYLRKLPAQQVKLDLAFTAGIPGDTSNEAIVRSTIDLAHTLGATVVAEGVEDQLQWEHLAGFGCDIAQGYLIGKPLPAAELTRRLTDRPALRIVA